VNVTIKRTPKSKPIVVHVDKLKPYHAPVHRPETEDHEDLEEPDVESPVGSDAETNRPKRNIRLPARFR
jgi:hypothetical protein